MSTGTQRYRVAHRTTYSYTAEMLDGYSVAMLLARETPTQQVVSSELTTTPAVDERDDRRDVFGNRVVQIGVHRPHTELIVDVETEVMTQPQVESRINPPWERAVAQTQGLRGRAWLDVSPFLAASRFIPIRSAPGDGPNSLGGAMLDSFSGEFGPGRPLLDVISGVCGSIFHGYAFDPMSTTVSTPLEQVIAQRSGVCQDFAHHAPHGV